ncbi:I66 family serine proteinase inhibitor [Streptomyces sp. NPDC058583]|uniref:I66 family serine proteinase inhibitor n=1 Tax=unclassified Streptomyces TaxID=2593676 RepID=UPI0036547FB7
MESGFYKIYHGGNLVGRRLNETPDLKPKAICNKTEDPDAVWVVEALSNGRYNLYAKGTPVSVPGEIDKRYPDMDLRCGNVEALIIERVDVMEWKLAPVNGKDDTYLITTGLGYEWMVPEPGKECEIMVMPLSGGETADTLFTFKPVPS